MDSSGTLSVVVGESLVVVDVDVVSGDAISIVCAEMQCENPLTVESSELVR